jgi:serine protease Do
MTRSQTVRQVLPMSVRIQVLSGTEVRRSATGVVVRSSAGKTGEGGRSVVLTNAHVADPAELKNVTYRVLLERHGRVEQTLPARLVALGKVPELDLALLQVDTVLPSAELATEETIDIGDDVVVVGAPYGRSLSVSGGMVSQLEVEEGVAATPLGYAAMKTDAAIGYGSSGGGVFTVPGGKLAGVVEGYRTARVAINDRTSFDVPMPGETFVAPVTKIRKFIAEHLGDQLTATRAMETTELSKPAPASDHR